MATPPEAEAGTLVTPTVRLVRLLDRGGMGEVWVADHLTLDTQVAVKLIAPEREGGTAQRLERFEREAKAVARLRSPHVVQCFDFGVTGDGLPFIVMELLAGETLGQRLVRGGPLSPPEAATLVHQVSKALAEAHGQGVVHRDIKPSNLFMTHVGEELLVKVLDFGIAKSLEAGGTDSTKTGTMVGTLHYMSPEQLDDSSKVGPSADLWSLAVVAYHALTGRLPYDASTPVGLWREAHGEDFRPPTDLAPHLPRGVDAWFRRALRADPAHRFADARQLASTFVTALDQTAISGQRFSDPDAPGARSPSAAPAVGPAFDDTALHEPAADLATGDFLAQQDLSVGPIGRGLASTGRSASATDDGVEVPEDREPAPPSAVKRRRSMAAGFGLGLGTVALALTGAWLGGLFDAPPPTGTAPPPPSPSATPAPEPAPSASTISPPSTELPGAAPAGPSIFPIGCNREKRPCGLGCCVWHRGCEPGSCDAPLEAGAHWQLESPKVVVWPKGNPTASRRLKDAEVWIRFGQNGVRHQLRPHGLVVTTEDIAKGFYLWIQPNEPGSHIIDLRPTGVSKVSRLLLCRGIQTRLPREGAMYSVWITIRPEGEERPELCAKTTEL